VRRCSHLQSDASDSEISLTDEASLAPSSLSPASLGSSLSEGGGSKASAPPSSSSSSAAAACFFSFFCFFSLELECLRCSPSSSVAAAGLACARWSLGSLERFASLRILSSFALRTPRDAPSELAPLATARAAPFCKRDGLWALGEPSSAASSMKISSSSSTTAATGARGTTMSSSSSESAMAGAICPSFRSLGAARGMGGSHHGGGA
jgi:hypothetical protein